MVKAVQYKTDQIADVKKIEKLNALFFTLMAQGSEGEGVCMITRASLLFLSAYLHCNPVVSLTQAAFLTWLQKL